MSLWEKTDAAVRIRPFSTRHQKVDLIFKESSTTKLLLRLFDANEGEILIDDRPIGSYKSEDLRKTISVLRQDYQAFPLTVSGATLSST